MIKLSFPEAFITEILIYCVFLLITIAVQTGELNQAVVGTVRLPACLGNVEINVDTKIVLESFIIVHQLCTYMIFLRK